MKPTQDLTVRRVWFFTAISILTGWFTFFLIPLTGKIYGEKSSILILMAAMFTPAVSSIITRYVTREGFGQMYLAPNFKGHVKQYLLIFFGPTILLFLSARFYFLVFPNICDPDLTLLRSSLPETLPPGLSPILLLALQIIIVGPFINLIPTLGEELGWRGYLLPKLRHLMSDRSAVTLTGVIWGFWHLPVIAMGHNYGTGYPGFPWLGILAMIIFCVVLGIIEGYATIKLKSVIPAAMIHSTVNAGAGLPILIAKGGYNTLLGPAITGLVGGAPFIIAAFYFYRKLNR